MGDFRSWRHFAGVRNICICGFYLSAHVYADQLCGTRAAVKGARGNIVLGADTDWNINTLQLTFTGELADGQADPDDIEYITGRMQQCPVSRNMREIKTAETTLTLA